MSAGDELQVRLSAGKREATACRSRTPTVCIPSKITTTPTPNPSPPQVGPARLAHSHAKPGRARVSWGGEHTECAATACVNPNGWRRDWSRRGFASLADWFASLSAPGLRLASALLGDDRLHRRSRARGVLRLLAGGRRPLRLLDHRD